MKNATIGRVLLYTLSTLDGCNDSAHGEQRPALVVRVWPDEFGPGEDGYNVQVFTDGPNDFPQELHGGSGLLRKTSVRITETPEPGALSWPVVERPPAPMQLESSAEPAQANGDGAPQDSAPVAPKRRSKRPTSAPPASETAVPANESAPGAEANEAAPGEVPPVT